jgi:hypothetical protein
MDERVTRPDPDAEADADDYQETLTTRIVRWAFWVVNVGFLVAAVVVPAIRAFHLR